MGAAASAGTVKETFMHITAALAITAKLTFFILVIILSFVGHLLCAMRTLYAGGHASDSGS
jgi:hypothetical protein